MQDLGEMEDDIFKERHRRELSFKARDKANRKRQKLETHRGPAWVPQGQFAPRVRPKAT